MSPKKFSESSYCMENLPKPREIVVISPVCNGMRFRNLTFRRSLEGVSAEEIGISEVYRIEEVWSSQMCAFVAGKQTAPLLVTQESVPYGTRIQSGEVATNNNSRNVIVFTGPCIFCGKNKWHSQPCSNKKCLSHSMLQYLGMGFSGECPRCSFGGIYGQECMSRVCQYEERDHDTVRGGEVAVYSKSHQITERTPFFKENELPPMAWGAVFDSCLWREGVDLTYWHKQQMREIYGP